MDGGTTGAFTFSLETQVAASGCVAGAGGCVGEGQVAVAVAGAMVVERREGGDQLASGLGLGQPLFQPHQSPDTPPHICL